MYLKVRQGLVAFGAALLTFAFLWGGQQLNQYTQVEAPLMHSLKSVSGVVRVNTTHTSSGTPRVVVVLSQVPSLQTTYQALSDRLSNYAGSGTQLIVQGQPDHTLTTVAQEMAFPMEQALRTGDYVAMRTTLLKMGQQASVKTYVGIDTGHIYLALFHKGHTFYKVVATGGGKP